MHKNKALIKALKFLNVAKAMAESWQKQGIVVGSELSNKLDEIEFSDHYCDGWTVDGGLIVIGNWNEPTEIKALDKKFHLLTRIFQIFEKQLHLTIEWSDTGQICQNEQCGGFIRTEAAHYFDKIEMPVFIVNVGNVCPTCIRAEPSDYITQLLGSETEHDKLGIDFSKHGYEIYNNGESIGISRSQKQFAERIRETGIYEVIFQRVRDEENYCDKIRAWVPKGSQKRAVH